MPAGASAPDVAVAWVVVAVLVAPLAVLAYGEMHRQVLRTAGSHLPGLIAQAVTVAGNAMSLTLPAAGSASAVIWSARALVRRGVPAAAATVVVAAAAAVSTVVLVGLVPVLLGAAGVITAPVAAGLVTVVVVVVVAGGAAARSDRVLATALTATLRGVARVPSTWVRRRLGPDPSATARAWAAKVRPLVPGPRAGVVLFSTAVLVYLLDAAALAAACRSVLPVVPWGALALGWVVAQVGMALQLTPGGLGLVETGLAGALLAAGLPVPQTAVLVAVYRGANWLLPAVAGWVVYLLLASTPPPSAPGTGGSRDLPHPRRLPPVLPDGAPGVGHSWPARRGRGS